MGHYDPETYVTDTIAASLIGCKPQTLRNWRTNRTGPPYIKLGRMVRYKIKDLLDFMERGRIDPKTLG
jgi:hypothetical protein